MADNVLAARPAPSSAEAESRRPGSILFVVNEAGEFVELQRVAAAAKAAGHEISFLFAQPGYLRLRQHLAACRYHGFRGYHPARKIRLSRRETENVERAAKLENGYLPASLHERKPGPSRFVRFAALAALVPAVLALPLARRFAPAAASGSVKFGTLRVYWYARSLVRFLTPDLVVFGQDYPGAVNSYVIKLCDRAGTPTLVIPFAVGTTKEMVESLSDKREHDADHGPINRLAARLFPRWVNYYGSKRLLRLPGRSVIVLEAFDLAPDHPWLPNSTRATAIAVESEQAQEYYQHLHFPESQLRLVGSTTDDDLVRLRGTPERTKARICKLLQLDPVKPILVCAWPTNQYGSRFLPMEFPDYDTLCKAWADTLSRVSRFSNFNVVIRPHPVTDIDQLQSLLRPYRLHRRVTMIDTLHLVSVADIFVACVSSTLRWAIGCGVPSVNYDCYEYGYTDFDTGGGVFTVKRHGEFDRALEQLTEDQDAYREAKKKQLAVAARWGMFDGKSGARIQKLIDDFVASRR